MQIRHECIEEWMNIENNTCPTCRAPIDFRSYFRRTIDFLTPPT